jgi:ABC-type bacteriocin/lantibiotic exporters, contain an N-terminal double-glycine peptidase domain
MENEKKNTLRRITDKLFGGLNMSWPAVIIFAVVTAVITTVFLIVPAFKNTSFENMGVDFEAWIFFAVIIMANCKKPLESSLKVFVFFLISQPLIYLLQVPFADMGWKLFGYYRTWFIWTLLTLPMAYIGWYIKKKNWLSALILAPVNVFLMSVSFAAFKFTFSHFPLQLVTAVFCLLQILLYVYAFSSDKWQKLAGIAVPVIAAIIFVCVSRVEIDATTFLPEGTVLTENAVLTVEDAEAAEITITSTGEDSMIRIHSTKLGTTGFTITDGDKEYRFTLRIYEDDGGHIQTEITRQ